MTLFQATFWYQGRGDCFQEGDLKLCSCNVGAATCKFQRPIFGGTGLLKRAKIVWVALVLDMCH